MGAKICQKSSKIDPKDVHFEEPNASILCTLVREMNQKWKPAVIRNGKRAQIKEFQNTPSQSNGTYENM